YDDERWGDGRGGLQGNGDEGQRRGSGRNRQDGVSCLWPRARLDQDKCLACPQRRAVPARTDACEPSADDVGIARPFTGSLNLRACAYGRGFHRARACRRFGERHAFRCGTMRIEGLGDFQPCGYCFLASSSLTELAMITSSPCFQFTGVATLCLAVSCSESITRNTSSKLRPVVIG